MLYERASIAVALRCALNVSCIAVREHCYYCQIYGGGSAIRLLVCLWWLIVFGGLISTVKQLEARPWPHDAITSKMFSRVKRALLQSSR